MVKLYLTSHSHRIENDARQSMAELHFLKTPFGAVWRHLKTCQMPSVDAETAIRYVVYLVNRHFTYDLIGDCKKYTCFNRTIQSVRHNRVPRRHIGALTPRGV